MKTYKPSFIIFLFVVTIFYPLNGQADIFIDLDSLYSDLNTGETDTQTLQVTNNGSSDLNISINILNSDTTRHRLEFEPGNRPRLSIQDIQNFWNLEHEYSSSSSGRPGVDTSTRTTRSWQLLANDPQDNSSPYDTENIYYQQTNTTLAFKYEYYEPWEDAAGNTLCVMYIDLDNDPETGSTIEFDYDILWEGIDAFVYSTGDIGIGTPDGTYLYEADNDEFVFYEPLVWRVAEDSTNDFSFAVNNEPFEGLTSSRMVSLSGSFVYDPDIVPNEGMLDLLFQPPWLSVEPLDSVVSAGSALDFSVVFDASGLFGGEYYADIVVASNDPDDPEVVVPAHLSVTSASDIWVDPDTVDFGVMFVDYGGTLELELGNDGTDVLNVSSITVDNSVFTVSQSSATIDYGETVMLDVTFMTASEGTYSGTITVQSDDPDEDIVTIPVYADAVEPPVIAIAPDSLSTDLYTGDSLDQVLTISNNGLSDLIFEIDVSTQRQQQPRRPNNNQVISRNKQLPLEDFMNVISNGYRQNSDSQERQSNKTISEGGSRPPNSTSTRSTNENRSWQLLYTDPDEPDINIDVQNVYGDVSNDEVLLKWDSYVEWIDPVGNGITILYVDADQDTSTGLPMYDYDDYYYYSNNPVLGADFFIVMFNSPGFIDNGIYELVYDTYYYGWYLEYLDSLTTAVVEPNSNEAIIGVDLSYFGASNGINFRLLGGNQSEMWDEVPDLNAEESYITYNLSPGWLSVDLTAGVIPGGSNQEIMATFNATGMFGGDYFANINFSSNDPASPNMSISSHMNVTGIPDIYIPDEAVDFGVSYVDYEDQVFLAIENTGTDILEVQNITSDSENLTAVVTSFELDPLQTDSINLVLIGTTVGDFSAMLTITSNDPDEPALTIPVYSTIYVAPDINVEPDNLGIIITQGETTVDTFSISNSGGSDLVFDIQTDSEGTHGALALDGLSGGLQINDHSALDIQNQISIELWINPSHISQNYPRLVAKGYSSTYYGNYGSYELALNGTTGSNSAGTAFATLVDANTNDPFWTGSYTEVQFDTWTHLATTYDGTYFRFYVNGIIQDEYWIDITIATNNDILSIGKWFSGNYNSFAGQIDELRIWDIGRSEDEIIADMNRALQGDEEGLVGYWNFDSGISDQSNFQHPTVSIGGANIVSSTVPIEGSDFLLVSPVFGTISAGNNQDIFLAVNNMNDLGLHYGSIFVSSNDPDENMVEIPVTVVVEPLGIGENNLLPTEFALHQNYPNPFNPITSLRYDLPENSMVTITIYDMLGREVNTIVNEVQNAGYKSIIWNATNDFGKPVATGVYLYKIQAGNYLQTKKMVLLK